MKRRIWMLAGSIAVAGLAHADDIVYYVAVDTANWTPVEQALQDMRKRYGIRYRPATSQEIVQSTPTPASGTFTLKIDRQTRAKGRIPKTEREFSELTTAARKGPAACYAWIYGQDSPIAKQLQGHPWADLGDDDGVIQCRTEASRVRSAQSLIGF